MKALRFIVQSVLVKQLIPFNDEKQAFKADRVETLFHKAYFTV